MPVVGGCCAVLRDRRRRSRTSSGGYGEGETPLPIPNRAVKPLSADGTWPARARESRSPPVYFTTRAPPSAGLVVVVRCAATPGPGLAAEPRSGVGVAELPPSVSGDVAGSRRSVRRADQRGDAVLRTCQHRAAALPRAPGAQLRCGAGGTRATRRARASARASARGAGRHERGRSRVRAAWAEGLSHAPEHVFVWCGGARTERRAVATADAPRNLAP